MQSSFSTHLLKIFLREGGKFCSRTKKSKSLFLQQNFLQIYSLGHVGSTFHNGTEEMPLKVLEVFLKLGKYLQNKFISSQRSSESSSGHVKTSFDNPAEFF